MALTTDSPEQVAKFFKDELTQLGWTEMPSQGGAAGGTSALAFSKDNAMITIVINSQDGQTSFMISKVGQ